MPRRRRPIAPKATQSTNEGAEGLREKLDALPRGARIELAQDLDVDPGMVTRWLSGHRRPDPIQRAHIEDKYQIFWRLWDKPCARRKRAA